MSKSLQPHGLWTGACQASPSFTNSWGLLKLISIESMMLSNHLILCHPLLLLPSIFPSLRVFPNELALCIRWPKYWSFSISSSNEYSGLISFRIGGRSLYDRACMLSSFSDIQLFVTLRTVTHQASLSMEFSRLKYWSELSCPPPGDLPHPGIKPASLMSPTSTGRFCTASTT